MAHLPTYSWTVSSVLPRTPNGSGNRTALVVLNQPPLDENVLIQLWNVASVRICVDGGANRWYDITQKNHNDSNPEKVVIHQPCPNIVSGDFDSIREGVLNHYRSQPECKVISTPDQDFTDFSKALKELCASQYIGLIDRVLVFVENTGRLDQIFANLETLCLVEKLLPRNLEENFKPVFLVSSSSLTWFMDHGKHKIKLPKTGISNSSVGLIPLGNPIPGIVTSGLKWNLDGNQELSFGKLISTSNTFEEGADQVEIETKKKLLFTMEIRLNEFMST